MVTEIGRHQTPTTSVELKRSWSKKRLSATFDSPSLLASLPAMGSSGSAGTQIPRNAPKPRPLSGRFDGFDDDSAEAAASAVGASSGVDATGASYGGDDSGADGGGESNFASVPTASPSSDMHNASAPHTPPLPPTPDASPCIRKALSRALSRTSTHALVIPPPPPTPDASPCIRKALSRKKITGAQICTQCDPLFANCVA